MSSFASKVKTLIVTTSLYASLSLVAWAQEANVEQPLTTDLEVKKLTPDVVGGEASKQDDLRDNYFNSLQNRLENRSNLRVENVEQAGEVYNDNTNERSQVQASEESPKDAEKEVAEEQNDEAIDERNQRKELKAKNITEDALLSSEAVAGSRQNIEQVLEDPDLTGDDKEKIKELLGVRIDSYQEREDSRYEGKGDPRERKEEYKADRQNR